MSRGSILVIDDDVFRLSPFFLPLLQAKGYSVRAFDRWGQAADWLEEASDEERAAIECVVLDIMFVLPVEDYDAYERVTGEKPKAGNSKRAGQDLIPLLKRRLENTPILVLTNAPVHTEEGLVFRSELEQLAEGVYEKPAQDEFYEALEEAISEFRKQKGSSQNE